MGNPVAAIGRKKEYPAEWSRKNATFMENSVFIIMFASWLCDFLSRRLWLFFR